MIEVGKEIVSLRTKHGSPWSQYAYLFLYDKRSLLIHSLTSVAIVCNENTTSRIIANKLNSNEINLLIENELFDIDGKTDIIVLDRIKDRVNNHLSEAELKTLFLITTDSCNLACEYCYEDLASFSSNRMMSYDTMKTSIDNFISTGVEHPKIFFYGGEPLLNWSTIKRTIKYVRDMYGYDVDLQITTNGTLHVDEIVRFSERYKVGVAISIDGPKSINDLARKWKIKKNKNSVFDSAIKLLTLCQETQIDYSVLCTLGYHNGKYIERLTKFFLDELKVDKITYNLLLRQPKERISQKREFWDNLGQCVGNSYLLMSEKQVFESRTLRYISGFVENTFTISECDAGYGSQIVVRPDGKIGPCQGFLYHPDYWLDCSNFADVRSHHLWMKFMESNTLNMKRCYHCPLQGTCGGGCHYNRRSFDMPNENFCQYMIALVYTIGRSLVLS